jgi:hypothetical protein
LIGIQIGPRQLELPPKSPEMDSEKGGWDRVARLLRRGDVPEEQCWLKGPDWCRVYG